MRNDNELWYDSDHIKDLRDKFKNADFSTKYFNSALAPTNSRNATEALKHYEATVDIPLSWVPEARAYALIGDPKKPKAFSSDFTGEHTAIVRSTVFSSARYMEFVARQYNTTPGEMKLCWKIIIGLKLESYE